ncbi:hypothetical protein M8C21_012299 [Ambrosia artemisiifolia]|uniref:Uncharacterized protein n=1 Tax=Ambrosia artemisiifolia TaxID=4212 RepID=A0AAD5G4V7_AMBAR|nr:hypothetical protein M8C21_012299 [Ambrosia artemisiifolia]
MVRSQNDSDLCLNVETDLYLQIYLDEVIVETEEPDSVKAMPVVDDVVAEFKEKIMKDMVINRLDIDIWCSRSGFQ